ncbi:RNA polymerase sigma factor [Sutcliffiella cohnii]|uniref:RNA polymerase sigma factor n=1 Tax=Sutcliffiella cohnii TaxID=33932 RepID=UPI002E1BCEB6|nr:RNA polymerase sigma factor [Sutcliffiella cohnii]
MDREWAIQKWNEWYGTYSDEIYRYAVMITGDHELAKDLTHDTFIKAFHSMESYRGETNERNWLYRIARNTAYDELRKRRPIRFVLDTFAANLPASDYIPELVTEQGEYEAQLYRSLQKIKRTYREVIILRKVKELSIRETAEILNWSEGKVKTTLHRALEALKKQMQKEGYRE